MTEKPRETEQRAAQERGYCYWSKDCTGAKVSAQLVTKDQCKTAGGQSWDGATSGCQTL